MDSMKITVLSVIVFLLIALEVAMNSYANPHLFLMTVISIFTVVAAGVLVSEVIKGYKQGYKE
ncbi:hypothetical protein CD149_04300 [Staphylococcus condimenti]|uniref:Uncharacterized protein n=1 Tax=Staphylococcus condimenti TaxID=70255 RepID=A0AB37H9G6_9STAP|nr:MULTISPECIES: hypothetical protein [Staphylococcus]AMY06001.1 hypothetical protein A4G25_08685 [Staphylococcus condimenti]APR59865.1 hypothetical protein BTZ13_00975 [Staphylococcus condimenti]MDK8644993.1 hypothetical protein [Staphylococcus condimenti]OFP04404.1 hypothetical protein HMPREF3007_00070 [Staphylococcus sp. HMSC065E08]PNZ61894.1 hypothetical protein CD149_04300 [Staphylococcus condimenti]